MEILQLLTITAQHDACDGLSVSLSLLVGFRTVRSCKSSVFQMTQCYLFDPVLHCSYSISAAQFYTIVV